ncbi:MAG: HAMP domain-containing histidine kinase [Sedimenticola sp.]|nr:HAMP domain-containing histidine kinase [Sedimenticola sp.]MCW8947825.1 HAMP domain-containing histidine kinase [Sedimenticola sp.]
MRRNSLTLRLIATSFAWVGVTLLVTAALLVVLFRGHIEQRFETLLLDHLEELVSASELTPEGVLQMTWNPSDPRFRRPHSGWYWEVLQSGVSVARSDSLWRDSLKVTEPRIGEVPQIQQFSGPEDEPLQVLVQDITFPESKKPFLFVVAGPIANIEDNVRAFKAQVAITLTALGIGLLLVVWFQVRFGLRPLQTLQRALGDIRKGKAQRLPENYPLEVEPMVSELNGLLDYNRALLERSKTQVGNLAHALKNPLTVIRNEANAIENEQGRVIREQAAAMSNSVDRYLSQARIAGTVGVLGARADVKSIIEDLCFSMERLYKDKDLDIQYSGLERCWFRGEAQDLEEMLGNLMDNASKWARSQVLVHAECSGGRLLIVVEDDGPGIPKQREAEVLERGRRLDEKVPGSGFGLDIVQDIAGLYHGSITLGRTPGGGLRAQLDLPAID